MAQITALLARCAEAQPADWHVPWLQGRLARDQRQLDAALAALRRAHAMAPEETAPAFDLAVALEWHGDFIEADTLYAHLLRADPASQPALLGRARVARALGRTEAARGFYQQAQRAEPAGREARLGLAWLDLHQLRADTARENFRQLLAEAPDDPEAARGLQAADQSFRLRFDASLGTARLAAGTATTASAAAMLLFNAQEGVEFSLGRSNRELPAERLTDRSPLPAWQARVGYHARTEGGLRWSASVERRERDASPAEHRVELRFTRRLGAADDSPLQWYLGGRKSFSSPWNASLLFGGLSYDLDRQWTVAGTYYSGHERASGTQQAVALDLYRETGARGLLVNLGVAYGRQPSNLGVHGRLIYPLSRTHAVVFSLERRSLGHELEASVGWRYLLD
ncbi:tetratricopeptide repeat protein [Ottowia sp.]|uniref:tetratricopeptide repeat protein n=1 Tax=Ottowia sp. TaxID=1898956 RepID=UPI0039E6B216